MKINYNKMQNIIKRYRKVPNNTHSKPIAKTLFSNIINKLKDNKSLIPEIYNPKLNGKRNVNDMIDEYISSATISTLYNM